ncbi:hypothetical protein DL96DRAFT_1689228 [Flagelloscypha sp. PMI_526]|nr:hypothetical protein DL96DRAFT_1689228 [Flagelloscypha sp. PMI_526]
MPSQSTPDSPFFPPEIEYKIFFLAATKDANIYSLSPLNLLSVCRRTYEWVDPLRFRTLFLVGAGFNYPEYRHLLYSKSSDFLARHVKHLFYDQCFKCRDFFNFCISITDLVLLADVDEITTLPNLSRYPKLKYVDMDEFMSYKFVTAMIRTPEYIPRTLTHINWAMAGDWRTTWTMPNPARIKRLLPALAYFKIEWYGTHDFIWDGIPTLASLEQFALVAIMDFTGLNSPPVPRPRKMVEALNHPKVISLNVEQDHWATDLKKRWRGEDNFWLQAERLLNEMKTSTESKTKESRHAN